MERMILTLHLSKGKRAELDAFLAELHDPASPNFHHWLTPEEFGSRFGPFSNGFTVDEVAKGRLWINFSGSAAAIERAFHTQIHDYYVNGRLHHANDRDPAIPRGLSDVVAGVATLHDFPRKMMNSGAHPVEPDYTSGTTHYLTPGDFAAIYNVNPLYGAGIDGTGQNIAIVGRTHPSTASSDWANFRSTMGLPANSPQIIINGPDPGDIGINEDTEADLDVEWSGAVAKNASILFVVSKSTSSTDGVDLSAQYILEYNLAAVMSTSFGSCEAMMGTAENNFYYNLWQQAASQGITSFVSSGDAGAAGCNAGSDTTGSQIGVNGLGSTPYNVAVGGSLFNEGAGNYWSTTNGPGYASALSYIPEGAWNESGIVSGGSGLWATGGGLSGIYGKPAWQAAPGVPAGNYRCVPDVALSAAAHDGYFVAIQGNWYIVSGTSASSPSFAGLMALAAQATGRRQGNANVQLYQLAAAQYASGGTAVFHDITSGNNSVPGVTGYACTSGYDPVTGLGSVDANALVGAIKTLEQSFTLTVTNAGTGGGTATSSPSGINCGSLCSAT
jgi:subtilase family serine protease